MNYYIADTHFGHANVLRFDNRPFENVKEMDKVIIDSWNSRVTNKDDIYIVGDFAYRSEHDYSYYLSKLNGKKHLIIGNHDKDLLKDSKAMGYFTSVDYYLDIRDNKIRVILSHYPIAEWEGFYRGSYLVYGHIHNNTDCDAYKLMKKYDKALNAGVCINSYAPCTLGELIENNKVFKGYN